MERISNNDIILMQFVLFWYSSPVIVMDDQFVYCNLKLHELVTVHCHCSEKLKIYMAHTFWPLFSLRIHIIEDEDKG